MTHHALLLTGAAALVVVLGAGAAVLLSVDARRRRLARHIAERVAPLAPARPAARASGEAGSLAAGAARASRLLARVCGARPERRDAYPLAIPLLAALPILPALLLERVFSRLLGVPLLPVLPLLWLLCCRVLFGHLHARHADKLYRQFPDALAMTVRSVRAGIPLHEAMRVVARESLQPTARLFVRVCDQMAIGLRLEEALRDAARRTGVAEYGFFTVALALQAQTGGSLAETLENLAEVIRKRVALRVRAIALAAEARTSAMILAALPLVAGGALAAINYDYIRPLFDSSGGRHILLVALSMLGMAAVSMRTLIKKSLA